MKRFISSIATFLTVVLISALIVPIAACTPDNLCTIRVASMGGLGLAEVSVSISADGNEIAKGTTDENGNYEVSLENGTYTAKIDNVPNGYKPSDSYTVEITNDKKEVVLGVNSSIITGEALPEKQFLTGDIMYDFNIKTTYKAVVSEDAIGNESISIESGSLSLAEAFEGKKAVLLNFWYVGCSPCKLELPAIMEAYAEYSNDVAILAINNYPTEGDEEVASYVRTNKVTYPMGKDSADVCKRFNFNAYPTSIMIDRYGVICEFHVGSVTDTDFWRNWFKKYTDPNYSQNITIGGDVNDNNTAEADKPADFGVEFTKNPEEISKLINSTGTSMTFSPDASEYSWPWKIEGDSIVPTNSGHYGTPAIIYASLNIPANTVLAFEYKLNCKAEDDFFFVAVDGRKGMGTQTIMDSGEKDWRTGYAYITLEEGIHEIAFSYYHVSSTEPDNVARVKVKNLHFITVDQMTADGTSLDIPYYTARSYNPETGGYDIYSDVKFDDSDGFYHVTGYKGADGKDPILFADMHNATPFFTEARASIYNNYISTSNCTFGGKNYLKELSSYSTWASNSDIKGLVPVTAELKTILDALYKSENPDTTAEYYSEDGWLEFCAFYKHYGDGESIGNPIKGLAYFTAIPAHETTGEPDDGNLNVADFQKLIMPRGLLFKFTPEQSAVYKFSSVCKAGTEAWLFNDGMKLATTYYNEINYCGDDFYVRNKPEGFDFDNVNFEMFHYLEAGKSYYLLVAFQNTDNLGEIKFRIDNTGKSEHKYLTTVTAGYLVQGENNAYQVPVYADIEFRAEDGYFYSKGSNMPIYCEFTDNSRMFNKYPIGTLLGKQGNLETDLKPFDLTGITLEFEGRTLVGKDFTSIMEGYYDKAVNGKNPTDELYGLTEVTEELRDILILFYHSTFKFDDPNEWLTACWYYDYTSASKPSPDTVLWKNKK
ncbi:MAG: redoxin domain-containing protein [Clostridia bacterium]|nr:redoxin domain-containing protein [Clostridia bacterium]